MKRFAWVTDIHLNFLDGSGRIAAFCREIASHEPEGLLVSGDIGEADSVAGYVRTLRDRTGCPVYFVLGNHDFYGSSIADVRREVDGLNRREDRLHWMTASGVLPLTEESCLLGHDSWADGRLGDFESSEVSLSDYFLIQDLAWLEKPDLLARLNALGDEAAAHFRRTLPGALERYRRVYVITHVPPFRDSCWYEGKISADDWLPHFSCRAAGEALEEAMRARPDREMVVLCGHTHGSGTARILPNLLVRTGGARYGRPEVQDLVEVP